MIRHKRAIGLAAVTAALIGIMTWVFSGAVWNEEEAVQFTAAKFDSIEDSTLLIGTHLIHLSALNDAIYEVAQASAEESGQENIYYKSELADGAWFDITTASSLADITTSGTPVTTDSLTGLYLTHHTKSDGKTYDLRTGEQVSLQDINDPYDLEGLDELFPLKNQYDLMQEQQSDSTSGKEKMARIEQIYALDLHNATTDEADGWLAALQRYYDVLADNDGGAEEMNAVQEVMNAVDASRRVEVYTIVEAELKTYTEELTRMEDSEDDDGETVAAEGGDSALQTAANDSYSNITNALIEYQGKLLDPGTTVASNEKYNLSQQLVVEAEANNHSACDDVVARLLALENILTETLYSTEEILREQTETERTRHTSESTTLAHNAREVLERMRRLRAMYQSDRVTEQQTAEQTTLLSQTEQQMQLVQNKTVQTDTQTLRERLDQIDRHNREMLERVQRARIREIERKHTETRRVDTSRVMQDALRALDHPEQVMGELMAQAAPETQPRLQLSPDAQTLLSQADEPTRRMLEAVMQYEANPSAGLPLPMQLQTATPAAFNAATAAVENEPPHDSGQASSALPDEMRQAMVHEAAQEVIRRVPQHQAADRMPMDNAPLSLQNAAPVDVFTAAEAQAIPMQNGSSTSVSVLSEEHQTLVHEAAQEVVRHALPRQTVRSTPQHSGPQPVQFVHKTEQRAVSEEILNQLEQQRQTVRQTEQTQVTEQHERMETRQIEQTQRRTVERMSEDVTELINRTLARQLGTISDKVYSQMEKRLRMERAARKITKGKEAYGYVDWQRPAQQCNRSNR